MRTMKEFETDGATHLIVDAFGLTSITQRMLERGLEYPHSIDEATPVAAGERLVVASGLGDADSRA